MIPTLPQLTNIETTIGTKSPNINFSTNRIAGWTDGKEALMEYVNASLNVERYSFLIHSWQFGIEINDLFGQPTDYVIAEIERRIKDALSNDDRILSVDNFDFTVSMRKIYTSFTVNTVYGEEDTEIEVNF